MFCVWFIACNTCDETKITGQRPFLLKLELRKTPYCKPGLPEPLHPFQPNFARSINGLISIYCFSVVCCHSGVVLLKDGQYL